MLAQVFTYGINSTPEERKNLRTAFVEEFYYILDDGDITNTGSTCATSNDCQNDSVMSRCCVDIVMT